ncbi:ABC transporter ATP-binding protein [Leptotrichia sp. OH3620_COT-345]|nr:ABC transporter ATP-binding protein [Leptotrichia sp. OH3620_COT-345]
MLSNIKLLNKMIKILEIKKSQAFFLFFICLISAVAHISYNLLLKPVIDKSLISENNINFEYIKLFLLSVILYILFTFIRKISFLIINMKIEKKLNYKVSETISQMKINDFDSKKEGEKVAILSKKVPELKNFFDNSFEKIIFTPVNFLLTMAGILLIDYKTGIVIIPEVLISILIDFKYGNVIIDSSNEVFKAENELLSYQKEVIEDMENIKMTKNENYIYKNYSEKSEKYLRKTDKMLKDYQTAYIPGLLNEYLPTILLLAVGIFRVPANKMSYGTFLSSLNLVVGASLPFSHFLRTMTKLKGQKAKIDEISELFKQRNGKSEEKSKNETEEENKIIEMKNVSYTYINKKDEILKNIDMEILKNEKVAIIGKTGSGKTTLLKIILGLYKVEKGTVRVFNMNPEKNT